MERRMKENSLNEDQIKDLLEKVDIGRITTINENGYPYCVPVHFVYKDGEIYIHGLNKGTKINNIIRNPKACFEIDEMYGLTYNAPETSCDVNTKYKSVIILGDASIVEDHKVKAAALAAVVKKYTPELTNLDMPASAIKETGVIKLTCNEVTGKYYSG